MNTHKVYPINLFATFFSGFGKDPTTSKYEIFGFVNQFSLVGQYTMNGKILILPVVGTGMANLTLGKYVHIIFRI